MMEPRLPSPISTRRSSLERRGVEAARVVLAPTGLVAAGVGVGIGELAGLPVGATVALAVFGWGARLLGAVWHRWWRNLPTVTIDPMAVAEPWRGLVRDALGARARFDETVARWPAGPLRDRLASAAPAVHEASEEVWRVAKLGASMVTTDAVTPEDLSRRLRAIQAAPPLPPTGGSDGEAALAAQLQAALRRQEATAQVEVHLRQLVTQLNVAVTGLATLAIGQDQSGSGDPGFPAIDRLTRDLGDLRQALSEISASTQAPGAPGGVAQPNRPLT